VYSVGAPRCPHCGSTEWVDDHSEEAIELAKINKAGVSDQTNTDLPEQEQPPVDVVGVQPDQDAHQEAPTVDGSQAPDPSVDRDEYDPADYTVNEVNGYLDDCRQEGNLDELERVLKAEEAGKNRSGILSRA
jgi:hypothetical protein